MKQTILILFIFLFVACKNDGSSKSSNIITDPELLPPGAIAIIDGIPMCEIGDHSCRDGTYGMPLNKKQCEYLQNWELGDPAWFFVGSEPQEDGTKDQSFYEIGPEGVVIMNFTVDPPLEIEVRGRQSVGMGIEKDCRCQINFENGLITNVIVESKWSEPTIEQAEICAEKEP